MVKCPGVIASSRATSRSESASLWWRSMTANTSARRGSPLRRRSSTTSPANRAISINSRVRCARAACLISVPPSCQFVFDRPDGAIPRRPAARRKAQPQQTAGSTVQERKQQGVCPPRRPRRQRVATHSGGIEEHPHTIVSAHNFLWMEHYARPLPHRRAKPRARTTGRGKYGYDGRAPIRRRLVRGPAEQEGCQCRSGTGKSAHRPGASPVTPRRPCPKNTPSFTDDRPTTVIAAIHHGKHDRTSSIYIG